MKSFVKRGGLWVAAQGAFLAGIALAPGEPLELRTPGSAIFAGGAILLVTAAANLGPSLSPLPEPAQNAEHVERGWYRLIRHPIYAGLILCAFGFAGATRSWSRFALAFALALMLDAKSRDEERRLAARYPMYEAYAQRTKRFIPWLY
jgi:protein-S-isoprenylcysteine O-methyltransferase Ste14